MVQFLSMIFFYFFNFCWVFQKFLFFLCHPVKTSQLMLYREIIFLCSEIYTKHINTVCGQNVELLNAT